MTVGLVRFRKGKKLSGATHPLLDELNRHLLKRAGMTLIIGFGCEDGIILAADDLTYKAHPPFKDAQTRKGQIKIARVGKNSAIAMSGDPVVFLPKIRELISPIDPSANVDVEQLAKEIKELADAEWKHEGRTEFIVGGFRSSSNGVRPALYHILHTKKKEPFKCEEVHDRRCYGGYGYFSQFLETLTGLARPLLRKQAKLWATILIELTSQGIPYVGHLGSVADITPEACSLISNGQEFMELRLKALTWQGGVRSSLHGLLELVSPITRSTPHN